MTEIIVLCTLHHLHGQIDFYTYDHLSEIIRGFAPDALACELRPEDLENRKPQTIKQEYQHSIYPLLDELACEALPLEPGEPLYSEWVQQMRKADEIFAKNHPAAIEQFGSYVNALYEILLAWWRSPADVNSAETDRHFEIKRRYQNALFGEAEAKGWERWNQHFLKQILIEAESHPQGRIVALVGVEHGYWLRKRLGQRTDVKLLDTASMLSHIF